MADAPPLLTHLRAHRERRGFTVPSLAKATGITRSTLYKLERNDTKGVDFATLAAIARVLRVDPDALFRAPPTDSD